jgi:DNA-binding CsgD family transcriptional regulator
VLSVRVLRCETPCALLQSVLAEEPFADGFWVALQARSEILLTGVSAQGARALRIPGLPSTLPVLRSPAAATAPTVVSFLEALKSYPGRTIAVAPVPTSIPWPVLLGASASGEILPMHGAHVLKVMAAAAVQFGHLVTLARLARLNGVLCAQAQTLEPWLVAEDDRIAAASPEAWRVVESLWRSESLDLKADYARLPVALSSVTGLDLPVHIGKTQARMAATAADFLPNLHTITFSRADQPGLDLGLLTPTERKILSLVLAGMSNRAIAEHLGRSVATAQNHVHAILAKLQASDRRELLIRAGRCAQPEPRQIPGLEVVDAGPIPIRKPVRDTAQKSDSA